KPVNVESEETMYSESLSLADIIDDDNVEEIIAGDDEALYYLINLESVIASCFTDVEEVHFSGTFRLEDELVNDILSDNDEENRYLNIALPFLLPIEMGSQVTVHLGCAQRDDHKYTSSDNKPVKRISEARRSIDRYPCNRKVKIVVNTNKHLADINIQHLVSHDYQHI
ncbi:7361_t:CDS:2, partial [Cetraspora pellucida]